MIVDSPAGLVVSVLPGVAANVTLLLGSYEIARHGFAQPRGLPAVLATAVVFWVACTLGLEVVGVVGASRPGPCLPGAYVFVPSASVYGGFDPAIEPKPQSLRAQDHLPGMRLSAWRWSCRRWSCWG